MAKSMEKIKNHLKQVKRAVILEDDVVYKLLGVRWYGGGMFLREEKRGKDIRAKKLFKVKKGDFVYNRLFAWKSSFAIVENELDGCLVSNEFPVFIYDSAKTNPHFLLNFVLQPNFINHVNRLSGGMSSVSRKRLKEKDFLEADIPKYSMIEQSRIVSQFKSIETEDKDLKQELTHQQTLLKKLRQQILQEAIEGKLTADWRAENPDVEPAGELLARIQAEKAQLIKDQKIKKQNPLPPICEDEKPFELPVGWVWCRLQDISKLITDGKHGDCRNLTNSGYYFLSAKDIQNGKLLYKNARQIVPEEFQEVHNRTDLESGDICMVNTGATVGKLAIAPDHSNTRKTTFQKSVAVIKVVKPHINQNFISLLLISETSKLLATSWGSAINNLLLGDLKKQVVSLPPLPEQKAIVTKVEKLLTLCDQLETQNTSNQTHAKQLMQAVLKEAFTHTSEQNEKELAHT